MILLEKLAQDLKQTYKKLDSQGELLSKSKLAQCYDTFRQKFGPDKLQSLDGEALLDTMHDHSTRDSLVYWLEFKDDDELPAKFGSIAGGSALKFGMFRRRETGAWAGRDAQNYPVEIPLEQAIEAARKHREQLMRGVELLENFPPNGTDADYKALQEKMGQLAPDVSNLAWGHKYFSMLYPDKLDDYHNPNYQRFHLIKLLQTPPQGEGRYICAGRYVAIANELDLPLNHLTTMLNAKNARPHRYWRVGTKLGGVDSRWNMMRNTNCVAIGWADIGDLSEITHNRESKEKIRDLMTTHRYPDNPQMAGRKTQEVFNFVTRIDDGDLVLPSDGSRILGIGRVVGGYTFEPDSDAPHRRPVEWLSLDEWDMPKPEGLRTTVCEVRKDAGNLVAVEEHLLNASPLSSPPVELKPDRVISIPRLGGVLGRIQAVLDRKSQVILYGPPGTGKTYWAEITAHNLAAYARYGLPFDQLSDEQKTVIYGDGRHNNGLVRICSFHPAYGYEDFLEGYRPQSVDGQLVFEQRDGIFKKLCQDAGQQPTHKFYLIIDEINRGDIPRIFGELLTVLEKDKRGKSILLPLSGKPFQVPSNVYVIGTMNTADRSIALLDTALRRRFGFVELMPDSSVLGQVTIAGIPLGPWLDALNRRLREHIGRDARNLQIGHAYLLDDGRPVTNFARFARIIQDDILPLLEEYCYEDYSTLARILEKSLVDESNQHIRHELFEPVRQDELVQALLNIDPDITTSSQAVTSEAATTDDEPDSDDEEIDESDEAASA